MFLVILAYDQCLLRPVTYWVTLHQENVTASPLDKPWMTVLFSKARWLRGHIKSIRKAIWQTSAFIKRHSPIAPKEKTLLRLPSPAKKICRWMLYVLLLSCGVLLYRMAPMHLPVLPSLHEIQHMLFLGLLTSIRVVVLVIFCMLFWMPIGVWIGFRPKVTQFLQPVIQFLAALPVNLFYPLIFLLIIRYDLNVEIWTAPLMVLGMQWYVLFNVIAGASNLSLDQRQAVDSFGLSMKAKWMYFIIPGIAPELITGAITAAGGAWNASIIAEVVQWRSVEIHATGLGSYIAKASAEGSFSHLAMAVMVMCVYVLVFNELLWQPLYDKIKQRFA
tara:strand:+ start:1 stop:996 length:996 start_codon:yes stop_codon:yes gene_type:complete